MPVSNHLVFSGNPGTGKTTVARLIAQIYRALGVLSKGQLVEVDRSGLVGAYVGQTAIKVQEVIQQAMGGVLFIDEAYSLFKKDNDKDYGREAIDTLLKAMEDHRDDFVVIVAGYPTQMEDFLSANPGLRSRFNKFIHFEDYSPDELITIFHNMCKPLRYLLSPEAETALTQRIQEIHASKSQDFANARVVRNLFEDCIMQQANRLSRGNNPNTEQLQTIEAADFKN